MKIPGQGDTRLETCAGPRFLPLASSPIRLVPACRPPSAFHRPAAAVSRLAALILATAALLLLDGCISFHREAPRPGRTSLGSPLVVVPAQDFGDWLVVEVKWDRYGPYRFLIDTGSSVTLPSALSVANTQLLLSEVSYGYKPIVGYVITGTLTLSETMYMSPRISAPTYGTTACS